MAKTFNDLLKAARGGSSAPVSNTANTSSRFEQLLNRAKTPDSEFKPTFTPSTAPTRPSTAPAFADPGILSAMQYQKKPASMTNSGDAAIASLPEYNQIKTQQTQPKVTDYELDMLQRKVDTLSLDLSGLSEQANLAANYGNAGGMSFEDIQNEIAQKQAELQKTHDRLNKYAAGAEKETPGAPTVINNDVWAGLSGFNKAVTGTLEMGADIFDAIFDPSGTISAPVHKLNDYYSGLNESLTAQADETANAAGTAGQVSKVVARGTAQALPSAILALMSGGASLGATSESLTASTALQSGGLTEAARQGVQAMSKNPQYWFSFLQSAGPAYEQALAEGASEGDATTASILGGLIVSGIEMGGIQQLPDELLNASKSQAYSWVKSTLQEGFEEPIQGMVSQLVAKLVYDPDRALYSTTDQNAFINPNRMTEELVGGLAAGGLLGGVQVGANSLISDLYKPGYTQDIQEPTAQTLPVIQSTPTAQPQTEPVKIDATQYGKAGQEAYTSSITEETTDTNKSSFDIFYRAGREQLPLSSIVTVGDTLTETQEAAYDAGLNDAIADIKAATAQAKQSTPKAGNVGFVSNEYASNLDKQTIKALDTFANAAGVQITYAAPTGKGGANGWYDAKTGTVYIAQDAENPALVVAKHEITHRLADASKEAYTSYRNYALEAMAETGQNDIPQLISQTRAIYKDRAGQVLTEAQAAEEIVADFTELLLTDEAAINKLVAKDRTVAQRFFDAVKAFFDKIRSSISGGKDTQNKYGLSAAQMETAEKLWLDALKKADTGADTRGVDYSLKDIGFVLPNGVVANIDNNREHYAIMKALQQDDSLDPNVGSVNEIVDRGGVRIKPDNGIELSNEIEPTEKQYDVIEKFIDEFDTSDFYVDFSISGSPVDRLSYKPWEQSTKRIMNDIRKYYKGADVSYSLKESDLVSENARLKEMNDLLKQQFKLSPYVKTDAKAIEKYANSVLDNYDSGYDQTELNRRVTELYDYIANSKDANGNELTWTGVKEKAKEIAADVLNASEVLNDEMYQEYADLRAYLRRTSISIPENLKNDVDGGYNEFRKRNFGRFTLSDSGTPIDVVYADLSESYPEFFNQDITPNGADQITRISEVLDDMKPVYENPFAGQMSMATEYLANEIIDNFYDVPQARPTFADRAAQKMTEAQIRTATRLAALRAEKNDRIAALKQQSRDRIQNILERERERRQTQAEKLRDKYEAREERGRERRSASSYKARIKRIVNDMSIMLLNPNDKRHIPESLKTPVTEFLASVDLTTDRLGETMLNKLGKLQRAYQNILDGKSDVYMDIDPDLMANIEALESIEKKRLSDMTLDELKTLYDIAKAVRQSVRDYNRVFNENERRTVAVLGQNAMAENGTNKPYVESTSRLYQMLRDLGGIDMLSSFEYFEELGGTFNGLFDNLRIGLDKKISNVTAAEQYIKNLLGETKVDAWTGDKAHTTTFKTVGGEIKLTPSQVMSLYLLVRQEAGRNHIFKGGIKVKPIVVTENGKKKINKTFAPVKVAEADVVEIIKSLTPEQTRIAEGISKFFTDVTAKWGNEVSEKLYGYKKFTEQNYFPIVSDENYIMTVFAEKSDATLKNMGFTKSRIQNATNPIIIEDVFDVYTRQSDKMGSYNAFVLPLSDLQKVYNYKDMKGNGSVKQSIEKRFGDRANQYFKKFMADINGGIRTEVGDGLANFLTKKYKAASIGANVRVILQQPTSYIRAAAVMDTKYLAKGFVSKTNWKEVLKHSPLAQWRDLGYFSLDVGRQMKDVFVGKPSVTELFMKGIGKADQFAWGRMWNAVKYEIQDTTDLTKGSAEYWSAVSKRFNEVVDRTQVIDTVFHRSQIMRSQSQLMKVVTSFMSEPTKQFNMLRSAVVEAHTKKTPQARAKARRMISSVVASMIVNSVVCSLVDMYRDDKDDDETFWKALTEKLFGDSGKLFLDGNLAGQFTGMIPFLKDIFSLIEGYSVDMMYLEGFDKLWKAAQKLYGWFGSIVNGEAPQYGPLYIGKELISAIGLITGIPAKNLIRELENLTTNGLEFANAHEAQYAVKRLYYNINNFENKSVFYDLLYRFSEDGQEPDKEVYNKIYSDLTAAGYGKGQISDGLKARIKKSGEFTESKADTETEIIAALQSNNYFKLFDAEYQGKALEAAKEFATSVTLDDVSSFGVNEKTWTYKAIEGASVGLEPYEYIIFKTAVQAAGEDDSTTQGEIIDILDGMSWLSRAQKDYLFSSRYTSDKNNPYN